MSARILNADCLAALRDMPDASVDAVVTDPPYGLSNTTPAQVADTITRWVSGDREYLPSARGFMGHEWDGFVPPVAVWDECLRVLKPGGHLLAFAGSRTQDLMGLAVRLAGFEIRDSIAWLHAQGFPKSLDVSKAVDKMQGAEREKILMPTKPGNALNPGGIGGEGRGGWSDHSSPATDAARQWEGWGTALKPAFEPVTLARKPLSGTVAANVLEHGTGALNIDACRVPTTDKLSGGHASAGQQMSDGWRRPWMDDPDAVKANIERSRASVAKSESLGRWPANVVLDESQAAELDRQGGASRFFYVAKAPKSERPVVDGTAHPTVKPLALMRWLVRMVTPPGGTVLDPFAGSGTTLEAAMLEGFNVIGIEREADYLPLIQARIERATAELAARAEADADALFPIDGAAS